MTSVSLEEALRVSDVVISGVPTESYMIRSNHLKDDCVAINVSSFKNFDTQIEDKGNIKCLKRLLISIPVRLFCWKSYDYDAFEESCEII